MPRGVQAGALWVVAIWVRKATEITEDLRFFSAVSVFSVAKRFLPTCIATPAL